MTPFAMRPGLDPLTTVTFSRLVICSQISHNSIPNNTHAGQAKLTLSIAAEACILEYEASRFEPRTHVLRCLVRYTVNWMKCLQPVTFVKNIYISFNLRRRDDRRILPGESGTENTTGCG